jgi:hypothetical protein
VKESPWADRANHPSISRRRSGHRRSRKTFDGENDRSKTKRRRSRNRGFRRFRHLMKNPEFSKKFWIIVLSISGLILAVLIVWDLFFRYPRI